MLQLLDLERMYWNRKNINTLVPIVKHYEVLEKEANVLEDYIIKFERNKIFDIYTQKVIENLLYVESSGLKVDKDLLPLEYKKHLSEDDIIYSQYNKDLVNYDIDNLYNMGIFDSIAITLDKNIYKINVKE